MTKWNDINDIIGNRPSELLLEALWSDPAVVARVRAVLNDVSIENIKHYRAQFVGDVDV